MRDKYYLDPSITAVMDSSLLLSRLVSVPDSSWKLTFPYSLVKVLPLRVTMPPGLPYRGSILMKS